MLFLIAVEIISGITQGHGPLLLASPVYLVYPIQTLVCGGLLWWFWPRYGFGWPRRLPFTIGIGILVFAIWIAPQAWFGRPGRMEGFDPGVFPPDSMAWFLSLGLRFIRLVVVVPLLEEIFWRGFLLRYLIDERFSRVPFGAFSWQSFGLVTFFFGLAHWGADFWAALLTGALYNLLAYRTKSLTACLLAHAITNFLLGIYIMRTGQWGFW